MLFYIGGDLFHHPTAIRYLHQSCIGIFQPSPVSVAVRWRKASRSIVARFLSWVSFGILQPTPKPMNKPNDDKNGADGPRCHRQFVRLIDVERITIKREIIPVKAEFPHEAFRKAREAGNVLTETETVEYLIKDYPEDH